MTHRELSDEGRALLSGALRVAPPASPCSSPLSSLSPGADPGDHNLAEARAALRRARRARDAPATSAAFHALARARLHALQHHQPGAGAPAHYLVALGHALLANKWRVTASSSSTREDTVQATVRRCRHRLAAAFVSDLRRRKHQFEAALGPCETVEGWYVHTLMAIAPPRPPNRSRQDPALRYCARGHLMFSRSDLDRYLRKFHRSHPSGDLRAFHDNILVPAAEALRGRGRDTASAKPTPTCRTSGNAVTPSCMFCPQCNLFESERCVRARRDATTAFALQSRSVAVSCNLERHMDLGQEILCKGVRRMSDRRDGVVYDQPQWDAHMLRAVRHVTIELAEVWLNDLAHKSSPYKQPCSFIESRDFTPAVVVCEPEMEGNNMDPELWGVRWNRQSLPRPTHTSNQLSGGVMYSAHSSTLVPPWAEMFLPSLEYLNPQVALRRALDLYRNMWKRMRLWEGNGRPSHFFPCWEHVENSSSSTLSKNGCNDASGCTLLVSKRCIGGICQPDARIDVFHTKFAAPALVEVLRVGLHALALRDVDRPMPQYWNIVDPNLCVSEQRLPYNDRAEPCSANVLEPKHGMDTSGSLVVFGAAPNKFHPQWIATDVLVEERVFPRMDILTALQLCVRAIGLRRGGGGGGRARMLSLPQHLAIRVFEYCGKEITVRVGTAKICSRIHWLKPKDHADFYTACDKVLTTALPMLARLRRPALLLPGPLQVVVKSQRMLLESASEEYSGCWHKDGKHECIVAVVLYYFDKHSLVGGDLEFVEQEPGGKHRQRVVWNDDAMSPAMAKKFISGMGHARVPVDQGTLVCFSNYQCLHRVLRMENARNKTGGRRDFLAFFVVDQRHPLQSSVNRPGHYAARVPRQPVLSRRQRGRLRETLLSEQLEPVGSFGLAGDVYSTGNGSAALLGFGAANADTSRSERLSSHPFARSFLPRTDEAWNAEQETSFGGMAYLDAMNKKPPLLRGVSWAAEDGAALSDDNSPWQCTTFRGEDGTVKRQRFVNARTGEERLVVAQKDTEEDNNGGASKMGNQPVIPWIEGVGSFMDAVESEHAYTEGT